MASGDELRIEVTGLKELIRSCGRYGSTYNGAVRLFLHRAGLAVQAQAMPRTPVVTGTLRRSMAVAVDVSSPPTYADIGTNLPYGRFIEFGERQGPSGVVRRKAGPARMLRDGGAAAKGTIDRLMVELAQRLKGTISTKG